MSFQMDIRAALLSVSVYKNLTQLPVLKLFDGMMAAMQQKQGSAALDLYSGVYYELSCAGYDCLADYLGEHLRYDSAPYPEAVAAGTVTPRLREAAGRDIDVLNLLAAVPCQALKSAIAKAVPESWRAAVESLPEWENRINAFDFEELTEFYQKNGAGLFSKYRAFLWETGRLQPVEDPDFVPMDQMVGFVRQRQQVIANTRALVEGRPVNNVLLFGDSGTGKSATVKALLGVPEFENLRLIELGKEELGGMAALIRMLGHRPQKFILFIDDLAFDQDDRTYSVLKTILEGGLEKRPVNVAIYATSNRRHLVRQTFSDRAGDELDANETIQEKTSLSERFGLRIPYVTLDQAGFLDMVAKLAEQAGVCLPPEELNRRAIAFLMRHPGRTPRVARQFIASLQV